MSDLTIKVLKRISAMIDNNSRMRWVIIIDMALERCKDLRGEGKESAKIAEESRKFMEELRNIFTQLVKEGRIELDEETGKVKLTEAGQKFLEEPTKTGPI